MEPVSVDLINNIFEITKERLSDAFVKKHQWMKEEANRLFMEYGPPRTSKRGWVYLISQRRPRRRRGDISPHPVFVKIGRTVKDPEVRLRALQGQNPMKLELLTYILTADSYALERELHRKYKDYRTEEGGKEWFKFNYDKAPSIWHPEWYKYYLVCHVSQDWLPEGILNFEGHLFSVLSIQEDRLKVLRQMRFITEEVKFALRDKGLLKESE